MVVGVTSQLKSVSCLPLTANLTFSQKEISNKSLRMDNPFKLIAYKDSYKTLFPVNKDSRHFNVPSLDNSVESLLIKKYGQKFTRTLYQI